MDYNLSVGMKAEKMDIVTRNNTAVHFGSGSVAVYATPAMVALMETASVAAVDPFLPEPMATVGIDLNIKHLAATPVGMTVRAVAELTEVDGKRLIFKVTASIIKNKSAAELMKGISSTTKNSFKKPRQR